MQKHRLKNAQIEILLRCRFHLSDRPLPHGSLVVRGATAAARALAVATCGVGRGFARNAGPLGKWPIVSIDYMSY